MWLSRGFLGCTLFLILGAILPSFTSAFLPSPAFIESGVPFASQSRISYNVISLQMSDRDDDSSSRLRDLGFSDDEIQRSRREPEKEKPKVRVDMVDNVDAVSLTAIGFAAIAFNFFVLANMEDGGIGGLVATIINSF